MTQYHRTYHTSSTIEEDQAASTTIAAAGCGSPSSLSSLTIADQVIVENKVPNLYEYWKSPTVKEEDLSKFHEARWLPDDLVCSPTSLDFLIIDRTIIVCFESYLMCGLGLPPSKFLVAILGYLGCELIYYNYRNETN
jgi:hypothetical protein